MPQITNNRHVMNWINSLQIRLMDSGYVQTGPEWHMEDECAPFSRVYYVHRGCGWAQREGERTLLKEDHIYLIPLGVRYDCGCDERFDHLYFHVNITPPGGGDLFGQLGRIIELPIKRADVERLVTLYRSPDTKDALAIAQRLHRDVIALIRKANVCSEPVSAYSELIQSALTLIREQLSAKLTIARLCEALNVPASTLTKRFRRELDMPLGAYMDSLLFQKAQQLLLFTDLSIGEIADLLEFCDPFYFSRYFKLHQKETPSRYRKRMKGGGMA